MADWDAWGDDRDEWPPREEEKEIDMMLRYAIGREGQKPSSWYGGHKEANEHARQLAEKNGCAFTVTDRRTGHSQTFQPKVPKAMPNTNPSDLDLEALERAAEAAWNEESRRALGRDRLVPWSEVAEHDQERWRGLARAAIASLPRASGVPEAEAVAWRFKPLSSANGWDYIDTEPRFSEQEYWTVEPLYASPPPVVAPSGEALRYAAQFLVDRLEDFELDETNAKEMCRQYLGFVEPAIARLKMELASPIASEPKDAGSGEGQETTLDEQAEIIRGKTRFTVDGYLQADGTIEAMHAAGYRITRTAPSGSKP